MAWKVLIKKSAEKQLDSLGKPVAQRIRDYLRDRVETSADPYRLCKALTGKMQGLYRFRVGDYRIITEIRKNELIVLVVQVGHRKEIYD